MKLPLASFFKRVTSDRFTEGTLSAPTILLVSCDPASDKLEELLNSLGYSTLLLDLGAMFPKGAIYNIGDILVRSKLYERIVDFPTTDYRLVVSTDLDNRVREVVDVANKLEFKTYLLCFDSLNEGKHAYQNFREGYDFPLTDISMFIDPDLALVVSNRKRGMSDIKSIESSLVSSNDLSLYHTKIRSSYKSIVLIEDAPVEFVSWIASYAKKANVNLFVRMDILKKDQRAPLQDSVNFIPSGSKYEKIKAVSNAIIAKAMDGYTFLTSQGAKSISELDEFLLCILDLKYGVDSPVATSFIKYSIDTVKLEKEISREFDKKPYKTLVFNLKRGDNLFGSLKYYPKMLGCNHHVIYRGGNIEGDVYASFGLPSPKAQRELINLSLRDGVQRPYYNIENGFLAFTGIALIDSAASHSLLLDEKSLYFNGIDGSSMEDKILFGERPNKENLTRAKELMARITTNNLSKYNHAPIMIPSLPGTSSEKVLIIDQRYADKSIGFASANENTFKKMLMDACKENPNADIIIKVHPDALTGLVKGHFDRSAESLPNVYLYSDDINPLCLLRSVNCVYAVSSQMGFEALMMGLDVKLYGQAIYGGWGLTEDRTDFNRRGGETRTLEELFYWLYMYRIPYVGPESEELVDLNTYIDELMATRGASKGQVKPVNMGDGEIVFNSVIDRYSVVKSGKLALGTVLALIRGLNNESLHIKVLLDLKGSGRLPKKDKLLDSLISYFEGELTFSDFKEILIEYGRLNDIFNFLVVFSYLFDQEFIETLLSKLCFKSSSEQFALKTLHWAFGHFLKNKYDVSQLVELMARTDSLSSNSRSEIESLYRLEAA